MAHILSFTGHREIDEPLVGPGIDHVLEATHPAGVYVGGAAGADMLAAERCYGLGIPYVMVLPHQRYPEVYGLRTSERWQKVAKRAEQTLYVVEDKPWHFSHNFKRNEWLVDHCGTLAAISKFDPFGIIPSKGGTAHCVRYARKVERDIKWVPSEGRSSADTLWGETR